MSGTQFKNILVRVTNWVGDAVMCIPALEALRSAYPAARFTILAKPWVADLYRGAPFADEVILYDEAVPILRTASLLRERRFDCAILLQNAFRAALLTFLARIPVRIGYARDGRSWLLTRAVAVPKPGQIPAHQRFYYLELLRRAELIQGTGSEAIRMSWAQRQKDPRRVIGVSPGAAYGTAKRWLPERFAVAAGDLAKQRGARIALFGSSSERALCDEIAALLPGLAVENHAGQTSLAQFIELAAVCDVFLTNDSGAMHIASALGVPTVAVFGATDDIATGPTGPLASVVRQPVECSPCLLRECPIDHRCMTRVTADRVVEAALLLAKQRDAVF